MSNKYFQRMNNNKWKWRKALSMHSMYSWWVHLYWRFRWGMHFEMDITNIHFMRFSCQQWHFGQPFSFPTVSSITSLLRFNELCTQTSEVWSNQNCSSQYGNYETLRTLNDFQLRFNIHFDISEFNSILTLTSFEVNNFLCKFIWWS